MAIIEWGNHFLTGLGDIDRQHQSLVALANRLSEAVGGSQEEVESVFQELTDYARDHFSLEEKLMEDAGVTPDYLAGHKHAHSAFVQELSAMWQARGSDPEAMTQRLLDFITVWIYKHILITDREMAREIHAKRHTTPPANYFYLSAVSQTAEPKDR